MSKRRRRHSPEQIVRKLRDADAMLGAGQDLAVVLQRLEISEATYHRWRNQYGGMKSEEAKRLKALEDENRRLKQLVADQALDIQMLGAHCRGKLVSPSRKRAAAGQLQQQFQVSEWRACAVRGQPRSTQRYRGRPRSDEAALVRRLRELVRQRPRFGYRRLTALLQREGWQVNAKRIQRLCRREGLKVRRKRRTVRAVGSADNACHVRRAERPNHVWCWDFAFDRTTSGTTLKWLSIVDEFTRECLTLKVDRSITSEDVIDTLAELFAMRGVPACIRSDNGPEFIAQAIQSWLGRLQIAALYIEPGSPWQNGYAESFHSKLVDEFLSQEEFESRASARRLTTAWQQDYNHHRPHSSLGYLPPRRVRDSLGGFRSGYALTPAAQRTYPSVTLITCGTENGGRSVGVRIDKFGI